MCVCGGPELDGSVCWRLVLIPTEMALVTGAAMQSQSLNLADLAESSLV